MAGTGSEPATANAVEAGTTAAGRHSRMTLRLRLTLLYGACFLVAGASLLAIVYGLVVHDTTGRSQPSFTVAGLVNTKIGTGTSATSGVGVQSLGRASRIGRSTPSTQTVPLASATGPVGGAPTGDATTRVAINKIRAASQKKVTAITQRANAALRLERTTSLRSLLTWSFVALGVMAILSIGLGWIVAGRALRPLRTMNRRARQISAENLHERLGVGGRQDELGDLAATFDALLARLEQAFEAQRRFIANASHELRTPLTLERALVEVALSDPEPTVKSLRHACTRILASTEHQERLIDTLLTLARGQAGLDQHHHVDLAALLEHELVACAPQLPGFSVQRDLSTTIVMGDPALLERLIGNLMENAIAYNQDQDPWLSVSVRVDGDGTALLKIANGGDRIRPDTVGELFVPFRRGAGERIQGRRPGLGLGLSIVQTITAVHGATITARALDAGGMAFELRFARAEAEPPPGPSPSTSVETLTTR